MGQQNYLGAASYNQAKSTLVHLFWMSKYDIPVELAKNLKIFMKGMKRHVAAKKMEDGTVESLLIRRWICELFLKKKGKEYLFACCFLTLEWNLMARSESFIHAHLFHIVWEDNCLAFCFAKTKMDLTGRNCNQVWHVYAHQTILQLSLFLPLQLMCLPIQV